MVGVLQGVLRLEADVLLSSMSDFKSSKSMGERSDMCFQTMSMLSPIGLRNSFSAVVLAKNLLRLNRLPEKSEYQE